MFKKGELYLARLNPRKGNEVGKVRPVFIYQTDMLNDIGHPTTIILALFTHLIVYQAGINSDTFGGTKIDRDDIKEAIIGLRKDFSAFVNSHLAFYRYIRQNHNIDPNNAEHQELLHLTLRNRTVFAYLLIKIAIIAKLLS